METPVSLLERLRHSVDTEAWVLFVRLYTPLLYQWLSRQRCPRDEIADLMQEVFLTLVRVLPGFTYDRHKSFRRWLRTVALNKWRDKVKQREPVLARREQDWADNLAANELDPFWETEYRTQLARRALEIMQADFSATTWNACWEVVAVGRSAAEVAENLGITVGAVHAARFRVLDRLRQELAGLLE